MKEIGLITFLAIGLFLTGCAGDQAEDTQRSRDILFARIMGLAYLEEDNLDEAETAFLQLIDLAPKEAMGYANLGLVYLRQSKFEQSKKQLDLAMRRDRSNPDIRMILAKYYELTDDMDRSVEELEKITEEAPDYIKAFFTLSEIFGKVDDESFVKRREEYLQHVIEKAPGSIVPQLQIIDLLFENGRPDEALRHLESLPKQFPEFPKEAHEHYDKAMEALHASNYEEAYQAHVIFHNFMKVTAIYQSGLRDLKGPSGTLIGMPVVTITDLDMLQIHEGGSILESMYFSDVTDILGLDVSLDPEVPLTEKTEILSYLAVGDYDGDGDQDIYLSRQVGDRSVQSHFLFRNGWGMLFDEASHEVGITHAGEESYPLFADFNNDGYLDLYIIRDGPNILYQNDGKGKFIDVTTGAMVGDTDPGNKAIFLDLDHDGDLDILVLKNGSNKVYRNNSDGTFSEQSREMGLEGGLYNSRDVAFGDFDSDGDLDVFIVNEDTSNLLFTNLRQGRFQDITSESGLLTAGGGNAVCVGDYDNDGFLDLFIAASEGGQHELFRNRGDGTFERPGQSGNWMDMLQDLIGLDAIFFDFDNDGFLDLLVAGKSKRSDGRGVFLFHNDGKGGFEDVSSLLPESLSGARQIVPLDWDRDGDLDIIVADLYGGFRLLQNEGGNINHYLKVNLVGLRTGNNKNNHFGIGSKLEIRAGDLYQMKVVEEPNMHFGLGHRLKADVVRILWTNGVPQDLFFPGSDQDLIESQALKGSCAFLYCWNGSEFVFVKDMMWKSALGMPLGLMGSNTAYAPADASREYLKIPGELLKQNDAKYSLRITEELWETAYFDQVNLIVVDHSDSFEIYVDERFSPPPYAGSYFIYPVREKKTPVSVHDGKGNDLMDYIIQKDDKYVSNFKLEKFQGMTEVKDLIIDLGQNVSTQNLFLFLNGWLFPSDASINVSIAQSSETQIIPLQLQVINKAGQWETVINDIGFPMGKDKVVVVDLSDKFLSKSYRIRIRTNMEIYWDHVFFSNLNFDEEIHTVRLEPSDADLHYRGFSRLHRKGGRYGPHWFDYYDVSTEQKWRDLIGNYTRYGDVRPLLLESDDMYAIMNAGDEMSIEFDAAELPELPDGWKRDFLIYSVGWIKDGDLNTAHGKTVSPLPFHNMTSYPYGSEESYPSSPDHQEYLNKYNTREVNNSRFNRAILDGK